MATSPVTADHVTVHLHEGPETNSQAVSNYAGAVFLIGAAVMAVGMGVGFILSAVDGRKKEAK